jgi:predicted dienelactone hydrolase
MLRDQLESNGTLRLSVVKRILVSAVIGIAAAGLGAGFTVNGAKLPEPGGAWEIGRVSYDLTDPTRLEPLSVTPNAHRRMMVYVWYPTDRKLEERIPASYLPAFDEVKSRLSPETIADLFRPGVYVGPASIPRTDVVENAPGLKGSHKFPLLLFSHGWGNPTFLYTAELEDIVSRGYIVAAVDHPYDTAYTRFPDGAVTLFAQDRFNAAVARPQGMNSYARERVEVMAEDNRYALTEILRFGKNRKHGDPFYGQVDETRVGAFGHSIGGLTAARTCQIDQRVRACMDQDSTDNRGSPFIVTDLQKTEDQPFFLFVVSSADVWSQRALSPSDAELAQEKITRAEFDTKMKQQQNNQTKQLAGIVGGSYRLMLFDLPGFVHRSFTDQTLLATGVNHEESLHNFHVAQTWTLAFFDKYLKGEAGTILDTQGAVDVRAKLEKFPHR